MTSIGNEAFYDCSSLTSVTIPEGVRSIGSSAFSDCTGLTSVTIPEGVSSIGSGAFNRCTNLTSVTIPSSVTTIGLRAFDDCSSLAAVHVSDIAAWCGIGFGDYSGNPLYFAKHLYLNGVEVKALVIPEGVTSIGDYAFINCRSLTSVTIPEGVTSIGDYAFYGCTSLTSVTSFITEPFVLDAWTFTCYDENRQSYFTSATLYVPKGTKAKYEATEGWNQFKTIVEIGDQPKGDVNGDLTVNVADIGSVIDVMAVGADPSTNPLADVNKDGTVDVADIAAIIDIMAANARGLKIED